MCVPGSSVEAESAKPHQHLRALEYFYSGRLSIVGGRPLVRSGPIVSPVTRLVLGLAHRIHVEDKLPAEHFGAQFKNYARKAQGLILKVW